MPVPDFQSLMLPALKAFSPGRNCRSRKSVSGLLLPRGLPPKIYGKCFPDGEELARLMARHGIGVRPWLHHEIKRIDEDYFDQEVV